MTRQNTDYGYDIQKVYLEMMMTDAESFVRCQAVFDPMTFDRRLQAQARFLNDYVIEHNAMPTFDMLNAATNGDLKHPGELMENHYDWLQQEFEPFNPNPLDLGGKILNNSTRVQLQDACNSVPRNNQ